MGVSRGFLTPPLVKQLVQSTIFISGKNTLYNVKSICENKHGKYTCQYNQSEYVQSNNKRSKWEHNAWSPD